MSKDFNVSNALDAVYPIFGGCGSYLQLLEQVMLEQNWL